MTTTHRRKKTLLSWSGGKDCAWALHRMRKCHPELEVVGLVTTFNETTVPPRVAMHGTRLEVALACAESVGLPMWRVDLPSPCSNAEYARRMRALIRTAKERGVEAMAFGDLFLQDVRDYRITMLQGTGITPLFPIWLDDKSDAKRLAREMIAAGVRATLATVDPKQLNPVFAGRAYDGKLLEEFPESVDWCGENGEFHTICTFGPAFSHPVEVKIGESQDHGGFIFTEVELAVPAVKDLMLADWIAVHITAASCSEDSAIESLSSTATAIEAVCGSDSS